MIRAENRLNAVLVRDVVSRMPMYEDLIKKLDVPQKLVEIDVTVVELARKDALDWQLSIAASGTHKQNEIAGGQNAANLFDTGSISGQGLAGALTHVGSAYNIWASLATFREKGKTRNVSRTSLLTVNNLAASMSDMQSYHAKIVGTEVATLQEVSAGTTLSIKPRILPSSVTNIPSQVWLSISLDDGGFEAVTVDAIPMKRTTSLQTQTAIFEDESIMLAGYFREIDENAGWGIPLLRDIPLIGWIFGGSSTRKEIVQRMFIITPHVVDLDVELLVRSQGARLRDTTAAEEAFDGAEDGEAESERRKLDREDNRERRREKAADELTRHSAELKHEREMRQIERAKERYKLSEDIRAWHEEEAEARTRLQFEHAAKAAAEAARFNALRLNADVGAASGESVQNPPPEVRKVTEDPTPAAATETKTND